MRTWMGGGMKIRSRPLDDKTKEVLLKILQPIWLVSLTALIAPVTPATLRVLFGSLFVLSGAGLFFIWPSVQERWRRILLQLIAPLVTLVGLGVVWWWWRSGHIPSDVDHAREQVHDLQARMEIDKLCTVTNGSGQIFWFRMLNAIDRQLVYEEDPLPDGQKWRIYRYGDTVVAIEKPGKLNEYVQEYYRSGDLFAFDSLDKDRRPKLLWYRNQLPSRIAPDTIPFWGDPAPFGGSSPSISPCQPVTGVSAAPSIPSIPPIPTPAVGYR